MSGGRGCLEVGRRLSIDNHHFHYHLHFAGTREVLRSESWKRGHPCRQSSPGAQHFFAFRAHAGKDARAPERASGRVLSKKSSHFRGIFVVGY
jgi:hypothetical protein